MNTLFETVPFDIGAHSEPGAGRTTHTDAHLVAHLNRQLDVQSSSLEADASADDKCQPVGALLAVADGPSAEHERTASSIVLDAVGSRLVEQMPCPDHGDRRLSDAFVDSLGAVEPLVAKPDGSTRERTSVALAYVLWPRLFLVHAGRTNVWLVRDGRTRRLLKPASVDDAPRTAAGGPLRGRVELRAGDSLVLGTDGLASTLESSDVGHVVRTQSSAQCAADRLAHLAVARGATDDVTIVVGSFGASHVPAAPPARARVKRVRRPLDPPLREPLSTPGAEPRPEVVQAAP